MCVSPISQALPIVDEEKSVFFGFSLYLYTLVCSLYSVLAVLVCMYSLYEYICINNIFVDVSRGLGSKFY